MGLPVHSHCSPLCVCASGRGLSCFQFFQPCSPHVPMPGGACDAGSRVLERLVLQPPRSQTEDRAEREQALFVGAHQVHHRLSPKCVAMKPHTAVEGEAHPLAAACEFTIGRLYWQVMRPSVVAGATGGTLPENRAQVLPGAYVFVRLADQPVAVAITLPTFTPLDSRKLFIRVKSVVYLALS